MADTALDIVPGLKESLTPSAEAVRGMSCMRPCAPLREIAQGLNADSAPITAWTRAGSTP